MIVPFACVQSRRCDETCYEFATPGTRSVGSFARRQSSPIIGQIRVAFPSSDGGLAFPEA